MFISAPLLVLVTCTDIQSSSKVNCNRKLDISTAPTKAKLREPAYSQALIQNKIDGQWVRSRESGRQTVRCFGGTRIFQKRREL